MQQFRTRGIVLRRVDYGEADRIITFLTPDQGLISAMVKGVRKQGSKLAGGIELFSQSDLTFVKGKGELDHVISSRLIVHYGEIILDYDRVALAYTMLKIIEKVARNFTDPQLYQCIVTSLEGLNDSAISTDVIEAWFRLNVLRILGQQPNLTHDTDGKKLISNKTYILLPDDGAFKLSQAGEITAQHIKAWRVLVTSDPAQASRIGGLEEVVIASINTIRHLFEYQFAA